jgi:Fic family protein
LNILYLISAGLLDIPVLYMSKYIIRHKPDYYEGLRRVTEEQDWEGWILFMLRALEETAIETHHRVQAIRALMTEIQEQVRKQLPKIYSKELIEILFEQPYCRIKFLERANLVSRQTAAKYLQQLAGIGILSRVDIGRESYYINTRFFQLLTQ